MTYKKPKRGVIDVYSHSEEDIIMNRDKKLPVELIEAVSFTEKALTLLTPAEMDDLHGTLAYSPKIGTLIQGTGGVRKYRFAASKRGKGKRGGVRIIYYYHSEEIPLAFLAIFAKGEKEDLSDQEKKSLKATMSQFVKQYKT